MKNARADTDTDDGMAAHFARHGVAIIEYALSDDDLSRMDEHFPVLAPHAAGAREGQFSQRARAWFAAHRVLGEIARRLTGGPVSVTRLEALDKAPQANWFARWHQDRAEDRGEHAAGYLQNTVVLRVHLDACGEDDGPLEVIAGTHCNGRLEAGAIAAIAASKTPALCLTERGDVLAMRPLLLHRLQRAKAPDRRRIIHIEYTRSNYLEAVQRLARAS